MLLRLFLALYTFNWLRFLTDFTRGDAAMFHQAVLLYDWTSIFRWSSIPVFGSYYSYHPPLGFALSDWLIAIGLPITVSIKLVVLLAFLGSFFLLRHLLHHLRLLHSPYGISFLYTLFALPLFVFYGRDANLDVLILFFSVCTLVLLEALSRRPRHVGLYALLSLSVTLAFLSKYSAVILCIMPLFLFVLRPWRSALRVFPAVGLAMLLGLGIASPLYITRNLAQTHSLLPFNIEYYERDAYIANAEIPMSLRIERILLDLRVWESRRTGGIGNIWKDLWFKQLSGTSPSAISIVTSSFYLFLSLILFPVSLGLYVLLLRPQSTISGDHRLIVALHSFFLFVGISCLLLLIYNKICTGSLFAMKTHYMLPFGWMVASGFALIAHVYSAIRPQHMRERTLGALCIVTAFLCINYLLPVY